jgi:hypothetical protein
MIDHTYNLYEERQVHAVSRKNFQEILKIKIAHLSLLQTLKLNDI